MNNGISQEEQKKMVIDLAVHGNTKIYDVFKKLGFNDVQSIVDGILDYKAIVENIDEQLKDLEQYQPEIRNRAEGILDMRDSVDKIRDREYHLLKFVRNTVHSKCSGGKL